MFIRNFSLLLLSVIMLFGAITFPVSAQIPAEIDPAELSERARSLVWEQSRERLDELHMSSLRDEATQERLRRIELHREQNAMQSFTMRLDGEDIGEINATSLPELTAKIQRILSDKPISLLLLNNPLYPTQAEITSTLSDRCPRCTSTIHWLTSVLCIFPTGGGMCARRHFRQYGICDCRRDHDGGMWMTPGCGQWHS